MPKLKLKSKYKEISDDAYDDWIIYSSKGKIGMSRYAFKSHQYIVYDHDEERIDSYMTLIENALFECKNIGWYFNTFRKCVIWNMER